MENQTDNLDLLPEDVNSTETDKKEKKGHGAIYAASLGRAATAQVSHHSDAGLASTGTNISYEGATAPGAGGSVGTGYASGKPAVDATISTASDYDMAGMAKPTQGSQPVQPTPDDDDEDPLD